MKFIIITAGCITGLMLALPAAARQKTLSVQVREGQLRTSPGFLSRVVAVVPYTEQVSVLEERTDWLRVRTEDAGHEGWMHASALTAQHLKLASGERDAQLGVSSDEQALAGRGFNSQVEAEFKQRNRNIDFARIDRMEALKIPVATLQDFLAEGGLRPPEGGVQ